MLAAAFARSLRDPFVHARNAALLALAATADLFSEEDCATKLLPIMCPSLVDKEKLIRDQAQKSVDIYIARIRKHAASMPDTVLSPPGLTAGVASPRMGTPANEGGWAGWAISSFTNKLASTSGTIESGANGTTDQRASSVPPTASTKPPVPLASKPGMPLHPAKSAASIPTLNSPSTPTPFHDDEADFADDAWGAFVDDTDTAATQPDSDPWGTPAVSKPASTTPFDDQGEPDFAGWLAAQSQSKGAKSALPKGLSKAVPKRAGGAKVGGGRKVVKEEKGGKKEEKQVSSNGAKQVKSAEDEIEGWGDDW